MEKLLLKFAIQRLDGTMSDEGDGSVEEMTAESIRFAVAAGTLEHMELDPAATFFEQNRLVLFIYLPASKKPVKVLAEISFCEPSKSAPEEMYCLVAEFREIHEEGRKRLRRYLKPARRRQPTHRRKQSRRGIDAFLGELGETLRVLTRMSEGRREDFSTHYAKLVWLAGALSPGQSDAKLGGEICAEIGRLASNLARSGWTDMGLRRVRIRKLRGREDARGTQDEVLVGWEESRPRVGRGYLLYLERGGIFRSAPVTQVEEGHFRTRNSLYRIQEA